LAAKGFGGTDRARRRMATRASVRCLPNLSCKYRCTLVGEIGRPPLKARSPSGVRTTGTARRRTSTFNRRPRVSLLRRSITDLGDGRNRPSDTPLEYALRPATARPSVKASSRRNPSRSATTAAHNVKTGARLIYMVRLPLIGFNQTLSRSTREVRKK
jgi:hypothetical protein